MTVLTNGAYFYRESSCISEVLKTSENHSVREPLRKCIHKWVLHVLVNTTECHLACPCALSLNMYSVKNKRLNSHLGLWKDRFQSRQSLNNSARFVCRFYFHFSWGMLPGKRLLPSHVRIRPFRQLELQSNVTRFSSCCNISFDLTFFS